MIIWDWALFGVGSALQLSAMQAWLLVPTAAPAAQSAQLVSA